MINITFRSVQTIKTWRGLFEVIPFKEDISDGDYYLVDYNVDSHAASPFKENEVVKILGYTNGYYYTDRGTKVKDYCLIKHLRPIP